MTRNKVFTAIKRRNGEEFAQKLRNYHSGIFDIPDIANIVKYAGKNPEPLFDYLVSLMNVEIDEDIPFVKPEVLANQAGYDYYHVTNYIDMLKFRTYYSKYEQLCSFEDASRCEYYHVVWLVKHDWDKISRGNPPMREDEYGTSVLCIQMLQDGGFISIKNRYNHTVLNPDNTYNSNPDNIIQGLSNSLKKAFDVDFSSRKSIILGDYANINNQIVKYNYEINNVYLCDDFYVRNGVFHHLNSPYEVMIDKFILNLNTNEITNPSNSPDSFLQALITETKGKKLEIVKNKEGNKCLFANGYQILELSGAKIVSIDMPNVENIADNFLIGHPQIVKSVVMNKVSSMGKWAFNSLKDVEYIEMNNLEKMDNYSFQDVRTLKTLKVDKLKELGKYCFAHIDSLPSLEFNYIEYLPDSCFGGAHSLHTIIMKNLKEMESHNFSSARKLKHVQMDNLENMGSNCFQNIDLLSSIDFPRLRLIGNNCFFNSYSLQSIKLDSIYSMGKDVFRYIPKLTNLGMNSLKEMGEYCFYEAKSLQSVELKKASEIANFCFLNSRLLVNFDAPEDAIPFYVSRTVRDNLLYQNKSTITYNPTQELLQNTKA